jgi:hypothetical protein
MKAFALLLLVGLACAERSASNGCGNDSDCDDTEACVARSCLPRGIAGVNYFVSIEPPRDGVACRATHTEHTGVAFGVTPTALALASGTTLVGSIVKGDLAATLPDGAGYRVAIDMPSKIPGQPPRVYATHANTASPPAFSILVPTQSVGNNKVNVRVVSPESVTRLVPPRPVLVELSSPLTLALPRTQDLVTMTGTLLTALQTPAVGMEARATASGVAGGSVISNEGVSDAMGSFAISVLANEVGRDAPVVDLALFPADSSQGSPTLHLSGVPVKSDSLQRVTLPPYPSAELLRVAVVGPDESGKLIPVEGAVMRFETRILGFVPLPFGGVASHVVVSESDASGSVELRLIPGVGSDARDYSVQVDTAPDSVFVSRCVPAYSVVASGGPGPRLGASIVLTRKAKLSGKLQLSDESSPGVVSITATGIGSEGCPNLLGRTTGQTVSNRAGEFELYLRVGLHRIDYVPAAGGQAPSAFELVEVGGDRSHRFVFPDGRVGEGRVEAPMNCSAAGLPVRVFGMDARESVPREIARALTDSSGRFRVVLPER